MSGGVALSSRFDGEGARCDIGLPDERLDLLTGSASFCLQFGAGFPCDCSSSVTVTVQVECPSPSADAFVIASFGTWTAPKPDTFSPFQKGKPFPRMGESVESRASAQRRPSMREPETNVRRPSIGTVADSRSPPKPSSVDPVFRLAVVVWNRPKATSRL